MHLIDSFISLTDCNSVNFGWLRLFSWSASPPGITIRPSTRTNWGTSWSTSDWRPARRSRAFSARRKSCTRERTGDVLFVLTVLFHTHLHSGLNKYSTLYQVFKVFRGEKKCLLFFFCPPFACGTGKHSSASVTGTQTDNPSNSTCSSLHGH